MRRRLTAAETGIWLGQRIDPTSPAFNTAECTEIQGSLDVARFERAVRDVLAAAATLQRRFGVDADGALWWEPTCSTVSVEHVDGRHEPDPEAWAAGWVASACRTPLAIEDGRLARVALLRTGETSWRWYQQVHHIAVDGYAAMQLIGKVAEHYRTGAVSLAGFDLAALDELVATDAERPDEVADAGYWADLLAGLDPVGLSPATALSSHSAVRRTAVVGAAAVARIGAAAQAARLSWGELVLAACAGYLGRVSQASPVVLGVPVMNRFGPAARVPATVMNLVPLVVDVADPDRSVGAVAAEIAAQQRAGRRHHRYRHEQLRRDLGRFGPGSRLFSATVNLMPIDATPDLGPGLATELVNVVAGPVEDVTIDVRVRRGQWVVGIDANPAVHSPHEVELHLARLEHVLTGLSPDTPLGRLDVLPPTERERVVTGWNATGHPVDPAATLVTLAAEGMHRAPDAVAIVDGPDRLTFAELDRWSATIAAALGAAGAGRGDVVAVGLPRSAALIATVWGVLRSGAAYLPLELDYPAARLEFMLADAHPALAIVDPSAPPLGLPPGLRRWDAPPPPADTPPGDLSAPCPGDAAYVLYTSGSTGRPKGAAVSHRAIVNRLLWQIDHLGHGPGDRIVHKTPIGFDVSVWELLIPAVAGSRQVLARPGGHLDPAYLAELLTTERATVVHFVPSMLRTLLATLDGATLASLGDTLRAVVCSGEALPADLAERFLATIGAGGCGLHNLYGPTEAAIDVTAHTVTAADAAAGQVPIGRPVWNTRTYVLDTALAPVPVGVAGSLYLGGVQLADGYVGRPELTAERFLADPYLPGNRIYLTGDRARWRPDGTIEYLGRDDDQVKLRGQRIELSEIEAVLATHADVAAAAVVLREDRPGDQRLVAYVVGPATADALVALAASELPRYMVPSAIVHLPELPLSPNGKLDRTALPAPPDAVRAGQRLPRTPREERVCHEFAMVLDRPTVGLDDGFFELGGHSLRAVELAARLAVVLGCDVPVAALFQAPTPAQLLRAIDADQLDPAAALAPVLALRPGGAEPPVWCVHPAGGLAWCYSGLAGALPPGIPLLGLQADALSGTGLSSLDAIAEVYVARIVGRQPGGPYRLLGWSVGGVIAHEVAVRLTERGATVELLALLDCYPAEQWHGVPDPDHDFALRALLHIAGIDPDQVAPGPLDLAAVTAALRQAGSALAELGPAAVEAIVDTVFVSSRAMKRHTHRPFRGDAVFFQATAPRPETWLDPYGWERHVTGTVEIHELACTHPAMVRPEWIRHVAGTVSRRLGAGDGS